MRKIEIKMISITDLKTDAIVNAANSGLWPGGVCGAIFKAAGYKELENACKKIGHCDTGNAVITPGFASNAKYIIHAVGPQWRGGTHNEPELLYNAYQRSLELAVQNNCRSIGFPLISAGIYGYPMQKAWGLAIGRYAKNYIDSVWKAMRQSVATVGLLEKFRQNEGLRNKLLDTGDAYLVE